MNIISDKLQLTKVLRGSIRGYKRTIVAITAFATAFNNVVLAGDGTVTVPYFPLDTAPSKNRRPGESYSAMVSGTTTASRQIKPDRNMVNGLSYTAEDIRRQPVFDFERFGEMKGEQLAFDVMADILGGVQRGRFNSPTIGAVSSEDFDETEVKNLTKIAEDEFWPENQRTLLLNPAFGLNLVTQPAIMDQSQSGSLEALRNAHLRRLLGWDVFRSAGVRANNSAGELLTADSGTNTITVLNPNLSVFFTDLDRVSFVEGTTLPTGLAAGVGYYVRDLVSTETVGDRKLVFSVSATPGGAAINITANGTADNTVRRRENLGGMGVHQSGLLVAQSPVEPTPAIRQQLYSYDLIEDDDSGIALMFKHFANADTHQEFQIIEAHYGWGYGEEKAIKPIVDSDLTD